MAYEVIWSAPAQANLEGIARYWARRNRSAGARIAGRIIGAVESLPIVPFLGAVYPRDRTGRTREILVRKYRVFYRVDDVANHIIILAVWHSAREEPELPD